MGLTTQEKNGEVETEISRIFHIFLWDATIAEINKASESSVWEQDSFHESLTALQQIVCTV